MSVLKVKNGNQWDVVPAIKGDPGDPAADESITDDMLVADGIKTEIEWLWGNQLMDSREGELLHAEDAYTAPAVDISVDGKSTQVTTTGKNLFDKDGPKGYWSDEDGSFIASTLRVWWSIPVSEGDVIRTSSVGVWNSQTYLNGVFVAGKINAKNSDGYVIPAGVDEIRGSIANNGWETGIVTINNSDLTYEIYTGGKPAPSPDYPQEIVSVNQAGLQFSGRNIFDFNFVDQYAIPSGGVRFTANGDGTFTVEAIADSGGSKTVSIIQGTGFRHINQNYPISVPSTVAYGAFQLPAGIYTFRSYSSNDATKVYLRIRHGAYGATGDGNAAVTFTTDGTEWCLLFIYVQSFATLLANGPVTLRAQLEVNATATDYEPYLGNTASLLPDGYSLRSLPDGTKDELHLSYLRPSKRAGWAWYSRELVQAVGKFIATSPNGWVKSSSASNGYYKNVSQITDGLGKPNAANGIMSPWFKAANSTSEYFTTVNSCWVDSAVCFNIDPATFSGTALEFGTWVAEHNIEFYMPLATPTTIQLDPIELPIMPSQTVNVWSDPATNLKMTYIQDSNLIIENLEATIADIATS